MEDDSGGGGMAASDRLHGGAAKGEGGSGCAAHRAVAERASGPPTAQSPDDADERERRVPSPWNNTGSIKRHHAPVAMTVERMVERMKGYGDVLRYSAFLDSRVPTELCGLCTYSGNSRKVTTHVRGGVIMEALSSLMRTITRWQVDNNMRYGYF